MSIYTDVMVDIETTGVNPDRNAIIQIGAVKFRRDTREVCPNFFKASLTMPKWRSWDQGTLQWWSKQKEVLNSILVAQRPYQDVMDEFQTWLVDPLESARNIRFWSKPTHFDYMFISSYFSDLDMINPLSYREATDLNSFIRGAYHPNPVDMELEQSIVHNGAAHDGLEDCFYQLKLLFAHLDRIEGKTNVIEN